MVDSLDDPGQRLVDALEEAIVLVDKLIEILEAGVRPMSGTMPADACEQALKLLRGEGT